MYMLCKFPSRSSCHTFTPRNQHVVSTALPRATLSKRDPVPKGTYLHHIAQHFFWKLREKTF